jgi:hypothetical protein
MSDKPKGKGPAKKKVIIKKPAKTAEQKKAEEDRREAAQGEAGPATKTEKKKTFYKTTNPITGKTGFYYTKNPTQLLLKKGVSPRMVNEMPTEDAVAALLPPELRENIFGYQEPRSRIFHEKLKLLHKTNFYNSDEHEAVLEAHADRSFMDKQVNGAWDWWMDYTYENLDDLNGIKYIIKDDINERLSNLGILNSDRFEGAKSYQEIIAQNDEIRRMEEAMSEALEGRDMEDRYNTIIAQQNLGENYDDFLTDIDDRASERERYDGMWSMYGVRGRIPAEFINEDELDEMKTDMFSEKLDDIGIELEEMINGKTVDVGENFNDKIDDFEDPKLVDVIDKYKAYKEMEDMLDFMVEDRLAVERKAFRDKLKGELEEMVGEGEITDELDMRLQELHNAMNLRTQFENMRELYDTQSIMEFIFDGDNLGFADDNDFINEAEKNEIDKFDGLMSVKDYIKEENGYDDDNNAILPDEFNERMDVVVYDEEEYDDMMSAINNNNNELDEAYDALEKAVLSGKFVLNPDDYDLDENNNLITKEEKEEEGRKNKIIQAMMNKKTGLPPELIEKIIDFLPDIDDFRKDATLEEQMENYELTDREKEMLYAPYLDKSVDSPDSPRYTELQYTDDEDDLRTATETEEDD